MYLFIYCGIYRPKSRGGDDALLQVDGFSARIKPEPKDVEEEEEEGIGDVDLFALDKEDEMLTVNSKWLHHLQVRQTAHTSVLYQPHLAVKV